ncbi:TPA: hypothetical protein ACX4EX_000444 [Yersinia enterocolitica]|uniref:hypothetical protein n=1 Tax=Yersinia enterocolitica TaxID=630 RepID=UPI0005FCE310|nr:hypothetical protein [Yersinia enterocolitica]EKN5932071.1 hypothetical protein [Yersinia enterocolitica]ELX2273712.1 hypothetical protein [Yersinia enterocolitica]CRE57552.1 Uncharacterised protein [Yersinia enterocolitica]HDL6629941.1 hypothetical protein [Yersinia enterocolitica]HDL6654266.1 hypothetical protein [Yersinia enterocolitica]
MRLTSSVTENSTEYDQMTTVIINAQRPKIGDLYRKGYLYLLAILFVLMGTTQQVRAETITIGKGSGIIWEGLPFNETLSGPLDNPYLTLGLGLLSVSNRVGSCARSAEVIANIAGYRALQIAPGVGLIPRASGSVSFVRYDGTPDSMTGTIGLPQTLGQIASGGTVSSSYSYDWCLAPGFQGSDTFYKADGERIARLAGTWVMVADGTQVSGEAIIPPMYFGSFAYAYSGDRNVAILPPSIILRISTLECIVSTPTMINFGSVERLTQAGAELATYSSAITTACSQASDRINANINLQFRALTSLYENQPTRLALAQGGGYITGEINNGVTGSGVCTGTSGLPFDNSVVKIGNILATEATTVINNQVTWRLCSGGTSLPIGNVTASAEMLVTFN